VAILEKHQGLDNAASLQEYEEVALTLGGDAFTDLKDRIEAEAQEAHARLASVEAGWVERSSALESSQDKLTAFKNEISEAKLAVKTSTKAVEAARSEVQKVKIAGKSNAGNPKLVSEKIRSLEAIDKDVFQPLKQASVKGAQGKNKLKHLQKVGKRFGFHEVLLNTTMPKVALKCIDRRQTFDRLVLDQMEAEIAKKHAELENNLKDEKSLKFDREVALQTAQKALADAQHQRDSIGSRLADAEKALLVGKQSVVAARRDLKKFDKDSQIIVRESRQLESKLNAFLDGPFSVFKKLEAFLLPAPLVKPVTREMQSTETRNALTKALTRIGTMTVPPSPKEMEEDGGEDKKLEGVGADQKIVADEEQRREPSKNAEDVGSVEEGNDNEQNNTDEEDLEETDKE
jgi:hypothetical protein